MKYLSVISPIPLIIFIVSLFLPFVEHRTDWNGVTVTVEHGGDINLIFLPLSIMIFILLIVNIWRTRFVAIVSFVLCFGVLFSLFLLQFEMKPPSSYTTHTTQVGYPIALSSVPILMVILLVNLVKTFKKSVNRGQTAD
jgi:hypothetical protein